MTVAIGAGLAAAAGGVTGAFVASRRRSGLSPGWQSALPLLGGLIAVLGFAVCLALGAAVGLLTWSSSPDPAFALVFVIAGCALTLLAVWLEPKLGSFATHFGLPDPRRAFEENGFDALLEARPQGGRATMWIGGVVLPLLPTLAGLECVFTRKGAIGSALWHNTIEGGMAIALGVGWIGVGAFLHFHFFFGLHPALCAHSYAGKKLALIVACAGLAIAMLGSIGAT